MTVREWSAVWIDAHDVSPGTLAKYRNHLRVHILPQFGETPLNGIARMAVKAWR